MPACARRCGRGGTAAGGRRFATWAAGLPFVSRPAVADIDGDGINEVVVCKGGDRLSALRASRAGGAPKIVWEAEGRGLMTNMPAPYATPLIADVDGDG